MAKNQFLGKYKSEILAAIIGALVAGSLSLASGLYNLTKSFEFSQNKEFLTSLRRDIDYLKRIERELDSNLKLLLIKDYQMQLKTESIGNPFVEMAKLQSSDPSLSEKEMKKMVELFKKMSPQNQHKITNIQAPREYLEQLAWYRRGNLIGDIDFDLNQRIDKLYLKIVRVNQSISRVMHLGLGSTIGEDGIELIKHHAEVNNDLIFELKDEMLTLKNDVSLEIERLKQARRKISKIF